MVTSNTVYLDTETTGLSPGYGDDILEISIIDADGSVILDTLVKPTRKTAWPEAEDIHGINPGHVADAPILVDLMPEVINAVRGRELVIYNSEFDIQFMPVVRHEASQVRCCMLEFANFYGDRFGDYKWQKLAVAARHVLHDLSDAHRALSDARACRAVWRYMHDPTNPNRAEVDAKRAALLGE